MKRKEDRRMKKKEGKRIQKNENRRRKKHGKEGRQEKNKSTTIFWVEGDMRHTKDGNSFPSPAFPLYNLSPPSPARHNLHLGARHTWIPSPSLPSLLSPHLPIFRREEGSRRGENRGRGVLFILQMCKNRETPFLCKELMPRGETRGG